MKIPVMVIDYGMSNLLSISRALEHAGADVQVISDANHVRGAGHLVLPGVGAFPDGMRNLREQGWDHAIREHVQSGKPFLGICLGMQMMLSEGMEMERTEGLGLISGTCTELPRSTADGTLNRIPHVGWETISEPFPGAWQNTPLQSRTPGDFMYFVHSYHAQISDPADAWAISPFGDIQFISAIRRGNCFGTQFHPEKSGEKGLEILREFLTV